VSFFVNFVCFVIQHSVSRCRATCGSCAAQIEPILASCLNSPGEASEEAERFAFGGVPRRGRNRSAVCPGSVRAPADELSKQRAGQQLSSVSPAGFQVAFFDDGVVLAPGLRRALSNVAGFDGFLRQRSSRAVREAGRGYGKIQSPEA